MAEGEQVLFDHPAAVVRRASTTQLLAMCREQQAFDPAIFDEVAPFFWAAEISSNRLDAYFTRMQPSSLRNYAAEAAAGVSFQDSHKVDRLGFGRSLTGSYEEVQADALARVMADFYTIPGLNLNGVSTDNFIRGVRAGIVRDVSIGFYGGQFVCSICGRDMWRDWECWHIPGVEYDRKDAIGNTVGKELAIAWVENAHLAEVSAVYDGATPGAAILKAQREADAGRMRPETARLLEERYRGLRLQGARELFAGAQVSGHREVVSVGKVDGTVEALTPNPSPALRDIPNSERGEPEVRETPADGEGSQDAPAAGTTAAAQPEERTVPALTAEDGAAIMALNARLTELGAPELDATPRLNWLITMVEQGRANGQELERARVARAGTGAPETGEIAETVRWFGAEVARLRPLADDGSQYRRDLIDQALAEGVRALGTAFSPEAYRGLLERPDTPLKTIQRLRDDWANAAGQRFQPGRLTIDRPLEPVGETGTPVQVKLPNEAYT